MGEKTGCAGRPGGRGKGPGPPSQGRGGGKRRVGGKKGGAAFPPFERGIDEFLWPGKRDRLHAAHEQAKRKSRRKKKKRNFVLQPPLLTGRAGN